MAQAHAHRRSCSRDDLAPYRDVDSGVIPLTETVRDSLPFYTKGKRMLANESGWSLKHVPLISGLSRCSPRYIILCLVAVSFISLFEMRRTSSTSESIGSQLAGDSLHPIQHLAAKGDAAFEDLVNRQSKTVGVAAEEYRRRYGRRPPPGFGEWFALAQGQDLTLLDEFDTMMKNLEPFWGLNPTTVRERMQSMAQAPHVWSITLNSTGFHNSTEYWQVDAIRDWLADMPWQNIVHDVEFLLDIMDEPTISVPYDALEHAIEVASTQKSSIDTESPEIPLGDHELTWHNFGGANAWEYMRSSCQPTDAAYGSPAVVNMSTALPDFVDDVTKSMDPCADAALHQIHGIWVAPSNLLLTKHLVPVFSQARPSRMNDILYPSPLHH